MKLYGTKPSHFTRKARVVLAELKIDFQFIELKNLLETGKENFANNPLHMFPVLEDDTTWIVESDRISEYLIQKFGSESSLPKFWPESQFSQVELWNFQSIINGVMESAVHRIRAERSGVIDIDQYAFFRQEADVMRSGLAWIDSKMEGTNSFASSGFCYLDICLICLLDWAIFRDQIRDLSEFENLERFQTLHAERPSLKQTHPAL